MNTQINYVILGAGQLGLAIMDELIKTNHTIKMINRSGKVAEKLPNNVQLETADVTDPDQVEKVCAGANIVFFCVQPPYHRWPELFPPMTASIIEGVSRANAKLVFGSNVYMYGPTDGQPIHEGLPYAAQTNKGKARAQVANMLLDAHRQGKIQVIIGRASDFYGPRVTDSALGEMLFEAALAEKPANMVGNLDLPHTLTFIRDFARTLIFLSQQNEEAYGKAWHIPNNATGTINEFIEYLEAEIGKPVKVRKTGKWLLRLVGLFNPAANEVVEMMYEFEKPFIVEHGRFQEAFDTELITPHQEAIKETVKWYQNHV